MVNIITSEILLGYLGDTVGTLWELFLYLKIKKKNGKIHRLILLYDGSKQCMMKAP